MFIEKAPRKHSLHEKTEASVLLKLFIGSNECCQITDAPDTFSLLLNVNPLLIWFFTC